MLRIYIACRNLTISKFDNNLAINDLFVCLFIYSIINGQQGQINYELIALG